MERPEEILRQYAPAMARLAAAYLPPGPLRAELEQEIALAIYRALGSYRGECSVRTYIYRVAHHCALRAVMRHEHQIKGQQAYAQQHQHHESHERSPDQEQALLKRERQEAMAQAVRGLPLGLRQPLMLRLEGLSAAEIGELMGLNEGAVHVRLHRATKQLKARLNGANTQDDD